MGYVEKLLQYSDWTGERVVTSVFTAIRYVESLHLEMLHVNTIRVTFSVITYLALTRPGASSLASRVIPLDEGTTDVVRQEPS